MVPSGKDLTEYYEGCRIMNPMKWPVWVRIAVIVTVLWTGWGSALWYSGEYGTPEILVFLFPVVMFWGVAWIILGISDRKIRMRVIKVLIGIPVVIIVISFLVGVGIGIYHSFFTHPTSIAP